jgi:hypothetical protein
MHKINYKTKILTQYIKNINNKTNKKDKVKKYK